MLCYNLPDGFIELFGRLKLHSLSGKTGAAMKRFDVFIKRLNEWNLRCSMPADFAK